MLAEITYVVSYKCTLHITLGTILGIINEKQRIAGKNNWKF